MKASMPRAPRRVCLNCGGKLTVADFVESHWGCTRCGFQRSGVVAVMKGTDVYRRASPEEAYSWNRSKKPWVEVPDGCLLVASWEEA